MPAIKSSACGKFILTGEHAVVYGQPAIALPLSSRRISLLVEPQLRRPSGKIHIYFPALGLDSDLDSLPPGHPIVRAVWETINFLRLSEMPGCNLRFNSQLPVGSGLGSSAAMSVATIRGLTEFLGHPLPDTTVNLLAFETEKFVHTNPSGVDNTVITYEKPVFFQTGSQLAFLQPAVDLYFILADSGIQKSTGETVTELAERYKVDPSSIQAKLGAIGELSNKARSAMESGNLPGIADAINQNQDLLRELKLSCPELDHLVDVALQSGALAAKLTGGGRGGHILALVEPGRADAVLQALRAGGALNPFQTVVKGHADPHE